MEDLKLARRRPILSLQKLSLVKVTTILSNNKHLLRLIVKSHFIPNTDFFFHRIWEKEWTSVQSMAKRLISEICISVALKENLLAMIWPVAYEIMLWKHRYAFPIRLDNKFLQNFCWTDQGKIDSVRTIRHILREETLPMRLRFSLAATVSLSKELRAMWVEMSNEDKTYFSQTNRHLLRPLLNFWTHAVSVSDNSCPDYIEDAIECAATYGFKEAIKYFFSIISKPRKSIMAVSCLEKYLKRLNDRGFLDEDEIDIIYFLFFQLSENERRTYFEKHSLLPLSLFLNSSEKKLFLDLLAERIHSLSTDEIRALLLMIFNNYYLGLTDYDYSKLFFDCWRMLPDSAKEFIAYTKLGGELLYELIAVNFSFLLENGTVENISDFISSHAKNNSSAARFGFHRGRWEFLRNLIFEGIVSVSSLKRSGCRLMCLLQKDIVLDRVAQHRILRFVRYVRNKIPTTSRT